MNQIFKYYYVEKTFNCVVNTISTKNINASKFNLDIKKQML